jgi:membrane-bound inhibitor of C-type lysozyme
MLHPRKKHNTIHNIVIHFKCWNRKLSSNNDQSFKSSNLYSIKLEISNVNISRKCVKIKQYTWKHMNKKSQGKLESILNCWVLRLTSVISALGRLRQEGSWVYGSTGYIVRPYLNEGRKERNFELNYNKNTIYHFS